MKLEKFRVTNFRSVRDSGWIDVSPRTVLVGRNESGKSNLLNALRTLKPPEGLESLSIANDFPADRSRGEYSVELEVVQTVWALSGAEQEALAHIFPRATYVTHVEVSRGYEPGRRVKFRNLRPAEAHVDEAKEILARLTGAGAGAAPAGDPVLAASLERLSSAVGRSQESPRAWAEGVQESLGVLKQTVDTKSVALGESAKEALAEITELAEHARNDPEAEKAAAEWVEQQLPTFLYLDEYPEIEGHQNLKDFLQRQREGRPREGDVYFEKLLAVAGLDPRAIGQLLDSDHETRRQLANRAGASVTRKLRDLWHDRALKVRFNLDGEYFNTLISDPNSLYDVEVNLNQRSRGFRWFFSFYVTFAADAKSGATENTVLLLDEPGVHLHALGQRDLLEHFARDFQNQILFATQSPFMVPSDDLGAVRTVQIGEEEGTVVSNTPKGDARTLFPVLHAIGAEIARGLFQGERGIVVESLSDSWYLRAVSDHLREQGGVALPSGVEITPAGSFARLAYATTLLASQKLPGVILVGDPGGGGATATELLQAQGVGPENVALVGSAFEPARAAGADLEDLFDPQIFDRFVRFTYRSDLKGKTLELDASIPRIVKRYAEAFKKIGLEFCRARPARLILRGMSQNPAALVSAPTRERFERLFGTLRRKLDAARDAEKRD